MHKNISIGLMLIVVGAFLIAQRIMNIDIPFWPLIWALLLLASGVSIHINYFKNRRAPGSLFPAGILVTYGILFLINGITNYQYQEYLSFVYPLGIGLGFFESYIFGHKKRSNLTFSLILLLISLYIFVGDVVPQVYSLKNYIVPVLVILLGVYILIKNMKNS